MKNMLKTILVMMVLAFVGNAYAEPYSKQLDGSIQTYIYGETATLTNTVEFGRNGKVSNACWCYGSTTFDDIGYCLVIAYSKDNGETWTIYDIAPQGHFMRITRWFKTLLAIQQAEEEAKAKDWIRLNASRSN